MYSSLFYDTSKKDDWSQNCSLLNSDIEGIPFDILDFTLARHFLCNRVLEVPHSEETIYDIQYFLKI